MGFIAVCVAAMLLSSCEADKDTLYLLRNDTDEKVEYVIYPSREYYTEIEPSYYSWFFPRKYWKWLSVGPTSTKAGAYKVIFPQEVTMIEYRKGNYVYYDYNRRFYHTDNGIKYDSPLEDNFDIEDPFKYSVQDFNEWDKTDVGKSHRWKFNSYNVFPITDEYLSCLQKVHVDSVGAQEAIVRQYASKQFEEDAE